MKAIANYDLETKGYQKTVPVQTPETCTEKVKKMC
jgi:hypothetical protein